jgi:hypothetical protein
MRTFGDAAFLCTGTSENDYCYATDSNTADLFRRLQYELNQYAETLGFPPLVEDGKLGRKTVSLLQAVAGIIYARSEHTSRAIMDAASWMAPSDLATTAAELMATIIPNTVELRSTNFLPKQPTTAKPVYAEPAHGSSELVFEVPTRWWQNKWLWIGLAGAVAAGGATWFFVRRRAAHAV